MPKGWSLSPVGATTLRVGPAEPRLRRSPVSARRRLLLRLGVRLALPAHRVELLAGGRHDLALAVPVALEAVGVRAAPVALDLRDGAVDGLDDAVELTLVADELVTGRGHRVGVHALLVNSHVSSPSEVCVVRMSGGRSVLRGGLALLLDLVVDRRLHLGEQLLSLLELGTVRARPLLLELLGVVALPVLLEGLDLLVDLRDELLDGLSLLLQDVALGVDLIVVHSEPSHDLLLCRVPPSTSGSLLLSGHPCRPAPYLS